ncbi:ABC transporter ATP-binding protein [Bosea sp. AAP35]|uniref:ABC transporter ATP-binding protein n=1 Tax=Bosea sp. AAP35 TaxID=1523417 RepID=UPI0006B917E7|nr:ABC transporter ATP-binding protein [Bosea sp. AAP35]KPF71354.1 ABC transporter ATP-binding protein [Bosea sp. AAP35]
MADPEPLLRLEGVCKSYGIGTPVPVEVLHDIDLTLQAGEFIALTGASGSGKSTMLNIIGLLDRPTAGRLIIEGRDTSALDDTDVTSLRGHRIGFIFQHHCLISAFTALENVMMPMLVDKAFPSEAMRVRAHELLAKVGLTKWQDNLANNMSGGQQQRVAIARSLAMKPGLILADEPTGNLDSKSADDVFALMREVNQSEKTTFLIVTHNLDLAARTDRIIDMIDGRIVQSSAEAQANAKA